MQKLIPKLGIIVPCYNEEAVLTSSASILEQILLSLEQKNKISNDSFICFVDDGSKDDTWKIIQNLTQKKIYFHGIKLAGNVGHQNALMSGLMTKSTSVDCLISIDADLQDDVQAIETMVDHFSTGSEIVFGVRNERATDTFFKKSTAYLFYKIMSLLGTKVIPNHADFRLLGRKSLAALQEYTEYNLFLRGIFPDLGFKSTSVYYDRLPRAAGETKYPLRKMIAFAWQGITSFSSVPLRIISYLGVFIFFMSMLFALYVFITKETMSNVVRGWASTLIPIYLLGGLQLLSIGVIGEYLGKIYLEVKRRPRYIVEKESPPLRGNNRNT